MLAAAMLLAATSGITTYCNPIDLDYQYNFEQLNQNISYRSGADPVIVLHKGEYYLFATIAGGWWHSNDLIHWKRIVPERWPVEDIVAPAAMSDGETIYLFQSNFDHRPIFSTNDPKSGRLDFFNRWMPVMPGAEGPWDPDLFRDPDTGRWFMYFGSSNLYPLYVIELDPAKRLAYKGRAKDLIRLHPEKHGWERFGQDHRDARTPFIEGATMNKHNGKYYLQYGAPGTEFNVYANGTYVADDPLGPFTYAPNNPVSYKPGGFLNGAGHGNTFQDRHGNFWNTGTPWIGVNWNFERRMAMFPAGFDADGLLYANTRFGDFPQRIPTGKWSHRNELFAGWMLLSYRKPVSVSSSHPDYPAWNLTDENPRSFWVAASNQPGQTATIDLGRDYDVKALQVNYTDYKSGIFTNDEKVYTQFRIHASRDGKTWETIADLTGEKRDRPNAYIELPKAVRARHIRYEHVYVAAQNLAISDIRVFGNGDGKAPRTPARLSAKRDSDARNAFVEWQKVPGAVGYNILWGIAPDKLYQTYQVWAEKGEKLEIRAMTVGQDYWVAIESFDENGVSKPSAPVAVSPGS
ncbi:MAG TPA: family 43 glycosylhydrolase [Thermoanaerobaculia bacterium]|nr:family 43 glycosylhydrolase [Thermoanaerobaculia bacterium]